MGAKFLVLWNLRVESVGPEMMRAVLRQQDHGRSLTESGKLAQRYHIVGGHGGAWIYDVDSHEELDHLLAASPAYNFSEYRVLPLAEMAPDSAILGGSEAGSGRPG